MSETAATAATATAASVTRTVAYPGPNLPAPPGFTLTLPADYLAHPAPGLLAVVEPADRREPFQPNLTIAADLVPAGADPAQVLARLVAETVGAYPGSRPGARDAMVVAGPGGEAGGLAVASQHLAVATPASTVDQVLTVYVLPAPPGSLTYAYTVVSSWLDQEHGDQLRRVHESFRLGGRSRSTRPALRPEPAPAPPRVEPTGARTGAGDPK
jgi:hypothetical protein